jgi:hypothetical protein
MFTIFSYIKKDNDIFNIIEKGFKIIFDDTQDMITTKYNDKFYSNNIYLNFIINDQYQLCVSFHGRKNDGSHFLGSGAFLEGDFIHIKFSSNTSRTNYKINYKIVYNVKNKKITFVSNSNLYLPDNIKKLYDTIMSLLQSYINSYIQKHNLQITNFITIKDIRGYDKVPSSYLLNHNLLNKTPIISRHSHDVYLKKYLKYKQKYLDLKHTNKF